MEGASQKVLRILSLLRVFLRASLVPKSPQVQPPIPAGERIVARTGFGVLRFRWNIGGERVIPSHPWGEGMARHRVCQGEERFLSAITDFSSPKEMSHANSYHARNC
jgi:hypothetical protein